MYSRLPFRFFYLLIQKSEEGYFHFQPHNKKPYGALVLNYGSTNSGWKSSFFFMIDAEGWKWRWDLLASNAFAT